MLLNAQRDIKAVSVSGTNGDALRKARTLKPHVVLLDLGLRNQSSLGIVRTIRKEFPKTEVIVMDLIDQVAQGRSHVHNMLEKLALHTRLELAHHALKTDATEGPW